MAAKDTGFLPRRIIFSAVDGNEHSHPFAYALEPYQRVVGTSRILDERFVIDAKVASDQELARADSHLPMVRALLAQRFKLRTRFETEIQNVTVIVRRQSDAPGPNLRPQPQSCVFPRSWLSPDDASPRCSFTITDGHLKGVISSMNDFARYITQLFGGVYVDETELSGAFQVEMRFDPASFGEKFAGAPSSFPSFSEALRKDLGLRLETQRRTMQVLVVESVEMPTDN